MASRTKNHISYEDFDSDFESDTLSPGRPGRPERPGSDIDDISTDGLLGTSSDDTTKKKRQLKKTLTKKKAPVKRARKTTQTKLNIPEVQEHKTPFL